MSPRRIILAVAVVIALVITPRPARAAPSTRVVILDSGNVPAYQRAALAFRDTLAQAVPTVTFEVHSVGDDRVAAQHLVEGLVDQDVSLIFAVGAKAAHVAATAQSEVPVVFTSVLDWRSYRGALGRSHVAGVALEIPADVQLTQMKLLVPGLRRVVVITRSAHHQPPALADLRLAARALGVAIEVVPIDDLEHLDRYGGGATIDTAVYPLADPEVYTPEGFHALVAATRRDKLPLIAFSHEFVEVGATLAIDINYADLGSQAALVAAEILEGEATADSLKVAAPVGTRTVVNEAAAQAIGLPLSASLVRLADDVYTTVAALADDDTDDEVAAATPDALGERDPWAGARSELAFFRVREEIVSVSSRWAQERSKTPSIVSVLTNEDLRALGARNLAEALELVPGFTHRYNNLGEYDLLFRGQNTPADLLVMIDGERLNSMYDGSVEYDLPLDNIRRIEIIRGPGSALYGTNAFAGVISVLTYGPDSGDEATLHGTWFPSGSGRADATSVEGSGYARLTGKLGHWSYAGSALVEDSQGAHLRMPYDHSGTFAADDPHHLNDTKRKLELTATVRATDLLRSGDRLQLSPKLFLHDQGPNFGPTEFLATDSTTGRLTLLAPLEYTLPLGPHLELTTRLSYGLRSVDDDLQIRPDGFSDRANPLPAADGLRRRTSFAIHNVGIEPQLRWRLPRLRSLWSRATLTAGGLAEYGTVARFRYDQNYLEYFGSLISAENFSDAVKQELQGAGIPTTGFQNYNNLSLAQRDADRYQLSAYLEGQVQVRRNWLAEVWLTAGGRLDVFSDYRAPQADGSGSPRKVYVSANPRGAIVMAPSLGGRLAGVTLKGLHGWAFRAPTFAELYDATTKSSDGTFRIPNENLDPESTRVSELSLDVRPIAMIGNWLGAARKAQLDPHRDALALRVNLFDMRTDDVIAPDPLFNPGGYYIINHHGAKIRGLEAELEVRITARDFLFVNGSVLDPEWVGDCIKEEADGSCQRVILNHDIRVVPDRRFNLGTSLRPIGLWRELIGDRTSGLYRQLGSLRLSLALHTVSDSANNARIVFEQLRFPFSHPGYAFADVGLSYQRTIAGHPATLRAFVYDVTDADVAEPLVLQLEPRPTDGYFLPRPGRRFQLWLEWQY